MLYFLLPTLITAGLVMWGIDAFQGNDNDDDNDNNGNQPAPQITQTLDTQTGFTVVRGTPGDDTYQGDERYEQVFAGKGNDAIYGAAGRDHINLGEGNDIGAGGEGRDRLFGGAGDDLLNGGEWRDYIRGGSGNDVVVSADYLEARGEIEGRDLRSEALADSSKLPAELKDFLTRSGVTPKNLHEFIKRDDVKDNGNDIIYGNEGNDFLWDVKGSNTIHGGDGDDNIGALDLKGAPHAPDKLYGGPGNDKITGDDGDEMWGGEGRDQFFISVMEATDKPVMIKDYEQGEKISIQIDTPDNQPPSLTYGFEDGVVTISSGSQTLVQVSAAPGATQLVQTDIDKIKAAVSVQAT